jgi:hypothetical protein
MKLDRLQQSFNMIRNIYICGKSISADVAWQNSEQLCLYKLNKMKLRIENRDHFWLLIYGLPSRSKDC